MTSIQMPADYGTTSIHWEQNQLIGNEFLPGDAQAIAVTNPATESELLQIGSASATQVDAAVRSARHAFDRQSDWHEPAFRRQCLNRLADLVERDADLLMASLIQEMGTPISHKGMQIGTAVAFFRWFASSAETVRSYRLPPLPGMARTENSVEYRPCGVVAAIIAYNYPLILVATKLGAAAAAGCSVVLMPSPQAPLTVLLLARLIREAGFPPGIVNVITGGPETGKALCEHPDVDKISFTGSVAVGQKIMEQASKGIKGVVLELGGKSAAIMLPGVDFSRYTHKLHARYLQNAGQGCGSPTRILVERKRMDEFLEISRSAYQEIRMGDPWDPQTLVGPVISAAHRARVQTFIDEAVEEGGVIAATSSNPLPSRGWYVKPTLVAGVDNQSRIAREEIFGPVGVVLPYEDVDHAIQIANDSELGLKAYLYGTAVEGKHLAQRLRVGTVVINGGAGFRGDTPMGGFKKSGIGREWGEEGVREFLEAQHIDIAEMD